MRAINRSNPNPVQNMRTEKGKRSQTRIRQAGLQSRYPQPLSTPPVLTRGKSSGILVNRKKQGKVRKKYYYALNTPGAEVRLPALPAITLGWRLGSGLLVVVLSLALYMLWNSPQFQLETAKVIGAKRLTGPEIVTALNLQGMSVVEASPYQMEADLQKTFPDLLNVSVQVGLPASLVVKISEREPILAWLQEGQTSWIDSNGIAFPPRGDPGVELLTVQSEGTPPVSVSEENAETSGEPQEKQAKGIISPASNSEEQDVLQVTGNAAPYLTLDFIEAIGNLSKQVPAEMPLVYHPRYGLGWNDPQGWKVYFGLDMKDMDLKLQEYQAIIAQLSSQGIQPRLISVEFIHAPFYRLE